MFINAEAAYTAAEKKLLEITNRIPEENRPLFNRVVSLFRVEYNRPDADHNIALQYYRFLHEAGAILQDRKDASYHIHHYFNKQKYYEISLDKLAEAHLHRLQQYALGGIIAASGIAVLAATMLLVTWPATVALGGAALIVMALSIGLAVYSSYSNDHEMRNNEEAAINELCLIANPK